MEFRQTLKLLIFCIPEIKKTLEGACTSCKFSSTFLENCSRNIPICSSNLSSLKPFNERESKSTKESHEHLSVGVLSTQYLTSFNERESKSRKESQERLSPGVLSTQYLTATVISSIHQSTVDVPFKENTYLTGFQFSYHL